MPGQAGRLAHGHRQAPRDRHLPPRGDGCSRKTAELGRELEQRRPRSPTGRPALDEVVEDDVLRLVFISCHPVLSREARVALTLRLLGGLTTDEIARAFLVAEPTVAQRIVRAKRTLTAARVPFEVPTGAEFTARLASVLEVIYLVFNEGYAATAGEHWTRPALCQEAMRLGRILAELTPGESEVHGLVALMEIQASPAAGAGRPERRAGAAARPGPRPLGPRARSPAGWPRCDRAERTGARARARTRCRPRSPPATPAPARVEDTDWARIAALYEALAELTPSPVVELNRAVAVSRAYGPAAGLELVDAPDRGPGAARLPPAAERAGDLLVQLGRLPEARVEFERAAALTRNDRERALLLDRAAACGVLTDRQFRA